MNKGWRKLNTHHCSHWALLFVHVLFVPKVCTLVLLFLTNAQVILVFLPLAIDSLNTQEILWKRCETYHLPVRDSLPSPTLHLVSSGRSSSPVSFTIILMLPVAAHVT